MPELLKTESLERSLRYMTWSPLDIFFWLGLHEGKKKISEPISEYIRVTGTRDQLIQFAIKWKQK